MTAQSLLNARHQETPALEVSATPVQDAAGGELERAFLALASGFTLHRSLPPPDEHVFKMGEGS